ncbi:MAG: hypothetical protein K5840_07005, partial [Eubacterium sp.]|nr:hypothetical protein [Eubacterium sp.]
MTESSLVQDDEFLKKAYKAALIPSILSILSNCITIFADGVLVGQRLGSDGLAAINICVPIYLALCIVGSFFASGSEIICSQEVGNNNREEARRIY